MATLSSVLSELSDACSRKGSDLSGSVGPSWAELASMFQEAARSAELGEYEERMGSDL